jgi:hypothetical protein
VQAERKEHGGKPPPAGDDRQSNADPETKRRTVKPVEGTQTGSGGLGYLEKPREGTAKNRSKRGK